MNTSSIVGTTYVCPSLPSPRSLVDRARFVRSFVSIVRIDRSYRSFAICSQEGNTALHLATERGTQAIVRLLLRPPSSGGMSPEAIEHVNDVRDRLVPSIMVFVAARHVLLATTHVQMGEQVTVIPQDDRRNVRQKTVVTQDDRHNVRQILT